MLIFLKLSSFWPKRCKPHILLKESRTVFCQDRLDQVFVWFLLSPVLSYVDTEINTVPDKGFNQRYITTFQILQPLTF